SPSRVAPEVEAHVHESPRSMTVPLIILAIGSIAAGWLGVPPALGGTNRFEAYLAPVFENRTVTQVAEGAVPATSAGAERSAEAKAQTAETAPKPEGKGEHTEAIEYILMGLSVALGFGGWWLAKLAYAKSEKGYVEVIDGFSHPVYMTLLNKYYVDEAYDYAFTGRRPIGGDVRLGAMGLGTAMWTFDANVIDGVVNGAGWTTKAFGIASSWWDKWIIDYLCVNGPAVVARLLSYPVRMFQWGLVQWYALVMIAGVVGFVWYYLVR
ncbi:MAG TPA: NADH-quinone oxidoreductase subunit L, partial [Terriglobales bacterium]|nr:NADH-quinone oxidoreductase subunit L [Terriglobales bacterium]